MSNPDDNSPEGLKRQADFLVKRRERLFAIAQNVLDGSAGVKASNYHMYQSSLDRLVKVQSDFDECQDDILAINARRPVDDAISTEQQQKRFDELVVAAQVNLLRHKVPESASSVSAPASAPRTMAVESGYKLGPITVPTFDGDYADWPTFINLYNAAVHNQPQYSKSVKFARLISYLDGEPLATVGTMGISDHGYDSAYQMLLERYQCEKRSVLQHYQGLLDLPEAKAGEHLSAMLAQLREHMHALTALNHAETAYAPMLVAVIHGKLSAYYRRRLDDFREAPTNYPTLEEVIGFLKAECALVIDTPSTNKSNRSRVLLSSANANRRSSFSQFQSNRHSKGNSAESCTRKTASVTVSSSSVQSPQTPKRTCGYCQLGHMTYQCEGFQALSVADRWKVAREKGLCFSCLANNHVLSACRSERTCRFCQKRHHSLLHQDSPPALPIHETAGDGEGEASLVPGAVACTARSTSTTTVLPTAQIVVSTGRGYQATVRALIDSGAQKSFISTHCAQLLHIKPDRRVPPASGLGQIPVRVDGSTTVNVLTKAGETVVEGHPVDIVKTITGFLPTVSVSGDVRKAFAAYKMADSRFDKPAAVDALLGADVFKKLLTGQQIDVGPEFPLGLGTKFGVVLVGPAPRNCTSTSSLVHVALVAQSPSQLADQLERFWQVEEALPVSRLTPDEVAAEEFYVKTTVQQANGRYKVRLPFKENHPPLGHSRSQAESRLHALQRRFAKDPAFKGSYQKFMDDYEADGFMSPVEPTTNQTPKYYLPHHGVFRASSSTTKLRVVFDASAVTSNGVSLNDILLSGPRLQNDIRSVLLNFRRHRICFSADVRQMFLMIDLHESDRVYQTILWPSKATSQSSVEYFLNTVTFGVCSSPFLAIRTLRQLALDHGHKYPRAARILLEDIYVDDICSGCDSTEEAVSLLDELIALLALGGFSLRKWTSSHPEILRKFPAAELELPSTEDSESPLFKVLGLLWLASRDAFSYSVKFPAPANTKRGVLSALSSIYDPCGWVAPVVFLAKRFMQELWRLRVDWDAPLPENISLSWDRYLKALPALRTISIPRLLHRHEADSFQLHGFSDASEAGYSAALYLRSHSSKGGPAYVSLVLAKTRVAPLNPHMTLPKLELSGASLLADVLDAHLPQLEKNYPLEKIICWSDSTVTLSWIRLPPYRLKTFVANRVANIQALKADVIWNHVRSEYNAADCASRGVFPTDLPGLKIWWHGPSWLTEPPETWPITSVSASEEDLPEIKPLASVLLTVDLPPVLPEFGSWDRAVRVTSWLMRYLLTLRQRAKARKPGDPPSCIKNFDPKEEPLSSEEVKRGERELIRVIQRQTFKDELERLESKRSCTPAVQRLTPFLDEHGLIRVGGRLRCAPLDEDTKHPLLISGKHPLARLIAEKYHRSLLHAGPRLLEAALHRKYWVFGARNLVRACVHRCVPCFKARPRNLIPLMGDLPPARVNPNPVFSHSGMDYCGPFKVKIHQLRSARTVDVYLCIFVCFSTKAAHLEVATDLTTVAFLAALKRFAARRGCPTDLYSDQGSNFVGAANEIERLLDDADPEVRQFCRDHDLKFHFNPPAAPHQGGLWESAVKSAKHHLKSTIGLTVLYLEEFQTLCCQVESMLNSRPLTPLSADPNDLQPLTPGHFLIGRPLTAIPERTYPETEIRRLRRWQLVEALFQSIWQRWRTEYIQTLQPRGKWTQDHPPLTIGTLVLIQDPDLPPLAWKMGRVTEVHPGPDNRVRVATVFTGQKELTRPVHKLFPLPVESSEN